MSNDTGKSNAKTHGVNGPRRWVEQRWLLDNVIRSVGIDWDQMRTATCSSPCGPESNADFAALRNRIQKLDDFSPAFEATARRREALARAHEAAGETVSARNNYFMAAIHWGAAQWPIDRNDDTNLFYNQRKRECYTNFAKLADRKVEPAWIPFQGKALPGWLHLPPDYREGRIPAVVSVPGMDGFKETSVWLAGDRWLSRGIAVLALEGPGQYESSILGFDVGMDNWIEAGHAAMDWMRARPEIDAERIALSGSSFGSFFGTIAVANEPRFFACAVANTCLEPGCRTIFEDASPTFKKRFMYMSGYSDEDAFDEFCKTLTWEGHVDRLRVPYLCLSGEADELSPIAHVERFMRQVPSPKRLVVYKDSRHGIGNVPSANLGPWPAGLVADWMQARFAGKPFPSERWYVDASGGVTRTPY